MEVMDAIEKRYSVREYADIEIEKDKLDKIMEAGRLAPTASNQQLNKHIIVTDKDIIHSLVDACEGQQWIATAPAVIVECASGDRTMICGQSARSMDGAIAMSYMTLEAVSLGLQFCWLGWFDPDKVKKLLNIPDDYVVIAVTPIDIRQKKGIVPRRRPGMRYASYLSWAVSIAEDDSHGYSQAARTGPDYDCSSFVWYALTEAGYELGSYPFATGSMPEILTSADFEQLPYTGMEDLMPGDILWVHGDAAQHTEMYMGEGQLVGASCDLDGGLPGDQSGTGGEIRVGGFYDDGWMGVFRSTAYGLGDIAIPQIYEGYDVGTIYTCTPHYGTWNWVYNQGRVHAAWIQAGSVYSENVAMIDDKYLIACTETFGRVGDWVTFYFEDGEAIECIIADAKSEGDPNWTPWGHIHGNQIDVIEAETNLTINPGTPGCMESWGGRRVVSATNHGAFV